MPDGRNELAFLPTRIAHHLGLVIGIAIRREAQGLDEKLPNLKGFDRVNA
jgi:hypothetical protein